MTRTPHSTLTGINGTIWRHTIGRFSNVVRIPINMIASVLQGLKIVGKVAALPLTYSVVGIHRAITKDKTPYKGAMSLKGIALSGIDFLAITRGISRCFQRAILAPEVNDPDLVKGFKATFSVLGGKGAIATSHTTLTVSQVFQQAIVKPNQRKVESQQ